jgi:hypothetical protein
VRFRQPRSVLLGVAVVLVAAAPTPAIPHGRAAGYPNRAMRGETLPATHVLRASDTGNSLSQRYYGSCGGALTILWNNALKRWRPSKRIVESERYQAGAVIVIPKPPEASINPPRRSISGIKETRT